MMIWLQRYSTNLSKSVLIDDAFSTLASPNPDSKGCPMAPLTPEDVEIIEKRLAKGKWAEDLVKEFLAEGRGSKTAVYRKIKRWTETGSAKHIPKPSGRPRTVTPEENAWMLEQLRKDSSLALDDLQSLLLTERDTDEEDEKPKEAINIAITAHRNGTSRAARDRKFSDMRYEI
ncbi:uncharacterized protein K489DRAFT_430943 [Dissoconium aciculare CBS 342.82]|uniref:Uncharacterized protein n=1 Tax=Dissoconium aciculare CBS 342.82 TaxID=1314786 RepID=A0A6J3M7M4_9PEZI|nr:uncharacterized protein K489DRAFT_430943 [Dissoconium aciculare CBS 342.82]KAF1823554.1 hypothetical protein K489DRAFT_430943 [Dissoconium aciculare CBS 342.82]